MDALIASIPVTAARASAHRRLRRHATLTAAEVRDLLGSIETATVTGVHDLAMIGVMLFCFPHAGTLIRLHIKDYRRDGGRRWLTLHSSGDTRRVQVHHRAAAYLDAYLTMAGIADDAEAPLFRSGREQAGIKTAPVTARSFMRTVRLRARRAGVTTVITSDTLRATGIALFLADGGSTSEAMAMAGFRSKHFLERYLCGEEAGPPPAGL